MAALANSIGDHEFIALLGQVVPPLEWPAEPRVRLGVDGTTFMRIGRRGRQFTLKSQVDCEDLADGRLIYSNYSQEILADPLVLVQDDYDFDFSEDFKIVVMAVRLVTLHKMIVASGGLADPSEAFLECEWDLVAVENET